MPEQSRLELVWPNKDKFLLAPKDDNGKPVWVERDHPAAHEVRISDFTGTYGDVKDENPYTDNLLFTGDGLDVLRILNEVPEYRREYRGKVKLIYIDPPFNTGQTFTHYDDWMEHSTWLSFMRDRLILMRDLLAPDGSIWVHLDDAEVHRMRCLMDEIFGAQNFITMIVWERTDGAKGLASISASQDYILAYSRDLSRWKKDSARKLPHDEKSLRFYKNPDNDPRGPWKQNADSTVPATLKNVYPIVAPDGQEVWPPDGKGWRFTPEAFEEARRDGRAYFKGTGRPGIKTYLNELAGVTPRTWWPGDQVGTNRSAKRDHLNHMFGVGKAFATPKPEPLIARILAIGSDHGDIVVDFFGGSGTTAAVAHKMGRRWVTAEISPETVAAFTRPRMEMVVAGEDPGGVTESVGWTGGGGFRTVEVGQSMYETSEYGVMLADWATNGRFSRAVAGQLGFEWQGKAHAPFCGVRGRMRLCVLDGALGPEEVRQIVSALPDGQRVTVVSKTVLPGAEDLLRELSPGSVVRKAPRDVLAAKARRNRR